jgi:hypothetical protein
MAKQGADKDWRHGRPGLAPDDLRDPLMAHAHDLGNGLHGQTLAVGGADGFVALLPSGFARLLQGCFAPA